MIEFFDMNFLMKCYTDVQNEIMKTALIKLESWITSYVIYPQSRAKLNDNKYYY